MKRSSKVITGLAGVPLLAAIAGVAWFLLSNVNTLVATVAADDAMREGLDGAGEDSAEAGPVIDHIAFVVRDVEQAAHFFSDTLGVEEPPVRTTRDLEQADVCYLGNPTRASAKLAFVRLENVTIELIEPTADRSAWSDFLEETGGGMHHITLRVEDLAGNVARLETRGGRLLQAGSFRGGEYAYLDMTERLQVILELLALEPPQQP